MIFKCANSVRFYTTVSVRLQFLCQHLIYELIFNNWNEKGDKKIYCYLVWLPSDWGLIPFPFSALSFRAAASFSLLLSAFWFHEILLCLINRKCAKKEPYFKSIYVRGATETIDHTKQAFCLILMCQENELKARVRSYVHIQWFLWCTDAKSLEMKYDLIGFSAFSNISKNKNDIKRIVSTFLLPNSSKIIQSTLTACFKNRNLDLQRNFALKSLYKNWRNFFTTKLIPIIEDTSGNKQQ